MRVRIYLLGGATAVLEAWRNSTIDVDLRFEPESDELLRAIPASKESLGVNIELASPPDFVPERRAAASRSPSTWPRQRRCGHENAKRSRAAPAVLHCDRNGTLA